MKSKINEQIYRLTLSNIYWIHNIFYVSFPKLYLHSIDDQEMKIIMQESNFIYNIEQ